MISDTIKQKITEALKAKDEVRVSTLRLLSSELHNALIEKKRETLTEDEEIAIVRREAKKRKDAIELFKKAGAEDKAEKEEKELEILKEFLPKEMSDSELEKIVDEALEESGVNEISGMGQVMGLVMKKTKGGVDGKKVSEMVKGKLSK